MSDDEEDLGGDEAWRLLNNNSDFSAVRATLTDRLRWNLLKWDSHVSNDTDLRFEKLLLIGCTLTVEGLLGGILSKDAFDFLFFDCTTNSLWISAFFIDGLHWCVGRGFLRDSSIDNVSFLRLSICRNLACKFDLSLLSNVFRSDFDNGHPMGRKHGLTK